MKHAKKLIMVVLVGALMTATGITATAVDYPGGSQATEITTAVAPAFTVTIPADTTVAFNALETDFGAVTLESARLAPNKAVKVTLDASGLLKNADDSTKTIPYTIKKTDGTVCNSVQYRTAGETTALKIGIEQAAWDAAFAGDYSDTVNFNISYVDAE